MKRSELIFNVISVPVDFLMIVFAATLSYVLRYRVETLPVLFELSYSVFLKFVLAGAPFLLILFALGGLYSQRGTRSLLREIGRIAVSVSAGLMIVVILFFFNRNLFPSRLIVLMSWTFIILLASLSRALLLYIQRSLLLKGIGLHKLLVIEGFLKSDLVKEIEKNRSLGYEIVGKQSFSHSILVEIENLRRQNKIDELLQADSRLSAENLLALVNVCEDLGIKFNYLPTLLESHKSNIETDVIGSAPVIRLRTTPLDGWGKVVKRIVDILVSFVGIIVFSPLFLLIIFALKLDSRGPIFFHQRRGSSLKNFEFYKFRTMFHELSEGTINGDLMRAELEKQNSRHGPYVKIKNDPRVTRVGRILRRTKLDEIPQFWHVLRGQMSLVGPRIHMVREVEKLEGSHKKIFTIKPGATGLAQINQFYNPELPFEEEIKLDLFYIESWSLLLDLQIILKTFFLLFTRPTKGNY